jgi:hypothetical protein
VSDYERSTTRTTYERLPEPVRAALVERAAAAQLSVPADAPAFVTASRRLKRPGLFARMTGSSDPDTEHLTVMVLGRRDILVATMGEKRGTAVLTARLEDVEAGALEGRLRESGLAMPDDGVSVTGFPATGEGGVAARGSFYVGLGAPDGDAARAALADAIARAKSA